MNGKKITELNQLSEVNGEDYIPIVDVSEAETKKVESQKIADFVKGQIPEFVHSPQTGVDLNNFKEAGQYALYGNNENSPFDGICVLEVIKYSQDWILQRITNVNQTTNIETYVRCFYSGDTWGKWRREDKLNPHHYTDGVYDILVGTFKATRGYHRGYLVLMAVESGSSDSEDSGIIIFAPSCTDAYAKAYCSTLSLGNVKGRYEIDSDGTIRMYVQKTIEWRYLYLFPMAVSDGISLNLV